ncbi:long-chain-fatty-acid--CoA ligase [Planococcus sp. ISL-110]|uniref:class I adenylate-forming enzyme family protein n=1 Tax=Planococcus sp. ISL-110 TaxID=2819167 RepID=UPI001BEC7238|nr:long-chain-fatty-acid--CoA ligase [Planococcus sp. ISL-110]MBT2571174.1 long-chain-fatty-acid--CoA ligase [Planococcus sp. ISL-110]
MNVSGLLERNARKFPEAEAVVGMGERMTFKQLDQLANAVAHGLKEQGIGRGDKVVLFMPNVPEFIVSYFAVQRLKAVIVPINAKLTRKEVEYILDHSDAKALIVHELLFEAVKDLHSDLLLIKTGLAADRWESLNGFMNYSAAEKLFSDAKEDDPSTILYTSGTTGKPKGVLFSHRNILSVAQMICVEMEMKPESRLLHMMPLSHSAPLHLFLVAGMIVGAKHILVPTFTPDLFLDTVEKEQTTHFFGAPVAYLMTAKHPQVGERDLSSMKWWIYGSAPLSAAEVRFVQQAFRTDNLVCVYGLTEAGPSGTLMTGAEHAEKAGSIGKRAALHTELRIIDEAGKDVGVDEIGEILLRGEGNMLGYYKNDEATKATFLGDWLKTGDLAKFDDDGFIWVVDRKKDLIISGGVNIYPKEIEEMLLSHPDINEVAVIGVPHVEWGETVKAYFAGARELDAEEIKSFIGDGLASFKIPRLFEQMEALPRNASGKILKQPLRERGV